MRPTSILLVDDDAAFRGAMRRTLLAEGHEVTDVGGGGAALRLIGTNPPDLLITDIIMPDGDGIELITAVRKRYPALPILAISGRGKLSGLDLLELAQVLGVAGVFAKPFAVEELLAKVVELTGGPGPADAP